MISNQISKYMISIDILGYSKISFKFSSSLSDPPATAAGIGPTMCARLDDPSGSRPAHLWPHGTFSSVRGPRSNRCGCCIVAARPASRSLWDAVMGPRLCDPLHDPCVAAWLPSLSLGGLFLAALRRLQNQ